jgi:hypothetical protein
MIADNQIATNAGWNDEMLAAELAALKDEAFDLDLLGFDYAEIDRLLADTLDPEETEDEVPEPPAEPVSRPGDLWICGEHRVLCGDATVLADVEKLLDGDLADMVFTDPPYNVNYATGRPEPSSRAGGRRRRSIRYGAGFELAEAIDALIAANYPPADVWAMTPREIAGSLHFVQRRRRREAKEKLMFAALATRGEPHELKRQVEQLGKA